MNKRSQTVSQPTAARGSERYGSVRMTHVDLVTSMRADVLDTLYRRTGEKVDRLLSVDVELTCKRIRESLSTLNEEMHAMKQRVAAAIEYDWTR
jgi:hypothetical protein